MQLPTPAEGEPEPVPAVEPEPPRKPEPERRKASRPRRARQSAKNPGALRRVPPAVGRGYTSLFTSVEALPSPSPGARVGFNFQRGGFRAGVEFGVSAPVPEDQGDGDRVVISLFGGNLYSCLAMSGRIFNMVVHANVHAPPKVALPHHLSCIELAVTACAQLALVLPAPDDNGADLCFFRQETLVSTAAS